MMTYQLNIVQMLTCWSTYEKVNYVSGEDFFLSNVLCFLFLSNVLCYYFVQVH